MRKILTYQKQIIQRYKNLKSLSSLKKSMDRLSAPQKRLAECVGLWLAEGGNKLKSEITFTNSCLELVEVFKKTINELFKREKYNQRIYVYSRIGEKIVLPYDDCKFKYYVHKKATKPFLIYRVASIKLRNKWQEIINRTLSKRNLSTYILRGFFAGEGNVKEVSHNSKILRISQKEQKEFIDRILSNLNITYSYRQKERSYDIYGKWNWDIFAKLKLADLHPDKKAKFWSIYSHFKEEHYEKNYILNRIMPILDAPHTTKQLSEFFRRTPARITDILIELKKQEKIKNFRIRSVDYWTNKSNLILVSKLKNEYLLFLDKPKQTSEFAKYFKVDWKSSFRRLSELQRLNLVRRKEDKSWIRIQNEKTVHVI